MKLNLKAFALACGLLWGVGVFIMAWWLILLEGMPAEGVPPDPTALGRIYIGFSISPLGSVIGLLWGFVDGAIGGAIFAWLYNRLVCRGEKTQAEPASPLEASE